MRKFSVSIAAVVLMLAIAAPASAYLPMWQVRLFAKNAIGNATRDAARRTGAQIIGFDVVRSSCVRLTSRIGRCRGWSELSYPNGEIGHCQHSVKVSETIHGGITTYRRLITCYDV